MASIKMNGRLITVSNEKKIWFPKSKICKGDILAYYQTVAPLAINHIKNHLLTMQRFPGGITDESFYQKNAGSYFPPWIKTVPIKKEEGGIVNYVVATNAATILYLVNQGSLVIHNWMSRADKLYYPDRMIFDLDPSKDDFTSIRKAALLLKDIFDQMGIPSFAMTTGSRGIHVCVPLKRVHTFDQISDFSYKIAQQMYEHRPKQFTLEIRKNKRGGKIFIDTLRNRYSATAVMPYSVRAREKAPVAAPLWWDEVKSSRLTAQSFTIKNMVSRLKSEGDPWADINDYAVSLKKILKK